MRPLKRVLKSKAVRQFFCWLASLYIRLVYHTGRWTVVGSDIPKRFWDGGKPFILGFWHGRLLLMPYCWDHRKIIHMLISEHQDGQLMVPISVGHFGIRWAAGSSTRGGAQALSHHGQGAEARRLRRHHPRWAARSTHAGQRRGRQRGPPFRRSSHSRRLRYNPGPLPFDLGPVPPSLGLSAAESSSGAIPFALTARPGPRP